MGQGFRAFVAAAGDNPPAARPCGCRSLRATDPTTSSTIDPQFIPLLLAVAAFAAGVHNAIAGGGSFLTFPALVFAGVPPIAANATSALAVSPGYLGSTMGFAAELKALPRARLRQEMLIAAAGGVAGALLLLVTPAKVFAGIVPWLLLFATAAFVVAGAIAWRHGLLMMATATAGGFLGARWARRLPVAWVRALVIATGLAMSVLFFWRQGRSGCASTGAARIMV